MVIPDCQVRPDVDSSHLEWVGNYAAEKKPDVVVCMGDFADMPSLSGYAVGKAEAEGKRYAADVQAAKDAMRKLLVPIRKLSPKRRPGLVLTLGNHEERIDREAEANPKWKGFLSSADLGYKEAGWEVHPFLQPVEVDSILYAHYFVSGSMGRPVSSAAALLKRTQQSAVMGHVQTQELVIHPYTQHFALFSGICYLHDEPYLTPQGNRTKRGIWMLHEVHDGTADLMFVSLDFLKRRYS
jgi:hypothetical protein